MKAKRILALLCAVLLTASLSLTVFADDTAASGEEAAVTDEAAGETEESADAETEADAAADAFETDMSNMYNYYDPSTPVMTINGVSVNWAMYAYWLVNEFYNDYYMYVYYLGSLPDDFSDQDETIKQAAVQSCEYFTLAHANAVEEGLEATDEQKQEIADQIASLEEQYGGADALDEVLTSAFLTRDVYTDLLTYSNEMSNLNVAHYGENGEKLTEDEIMQWAADNNYVHVKHILYSFPDDTEDEAAMEEVRSQAAATLEELRGIEDQDEMVARFDEIMNADSSDTGGLESFPDGYTFASGTMVAEFEDAAFALEDYELSDVVETDYGCHILLRLPMTPDSVTSDQNSSTGEYYTLREDAAGEMFNQEILTWLSEADVQYDPSFVDHTINEYVAGNPDRADAQSTEGTAAAAASAVSPRNRLIAVGLIVLVIVVAAVALVLTRERKTEEKKVEAADAPAPEVPAAPAEETAAPEKTEAPAEESAAETPDESSKSDNT